MGDAARQTGRDLAIIVEAASLGAEAVQVASSRPGSELVEDQPLQRLHRLEILGRNLGLRKGEIELGFDLEHQGDHVHRVQSDIYQPRLRVHIGGDRVLLEDAPDDEKNTVLNAGAKVLHFNPYPSREMARSSSARRYLTATQVNSSTSEVPRSEAYCSPTSTFAPPTPQAQSVR